MNQFIFSFADFARIVALGSNVERNCSLETENEDADFVDILMKVYPGTEKHPRGGLMSQHVFSLKEGDALRLWGPRGKLLYKGIKPKAYLCYMELNLLVTLTACKLKGLKVAKSPNSLRQRAFV